MKSSPFNKPSNNLLNNPLKVINIGLKSFNDSLRELHVPSVHVNWKPPLIETKDYKWTSPIFDEKQKLIDKNNKWALEILLNSNPMLVGIGTALETIPKMKKRLILHAGPPITWNRMCGPMKGAIVGALLYEDLAKNPEDAEKLAASGEIEFAPCHEYSAVGPMAGIISASMPVFIVKNEKYDKLVYATMNEGLGKVLRYGANSSEVLTRLKWMEKTLFRVMNGAILVLEKIDLKNIISQALHMGDELHNRNRAATSLLYRQLAPVISKLGVDRTSVVEVLEFINSNDHFFLNLSMAASKATLDAISDIPYSTIVSVMARNGTDFGIKVAGMGPKEWFVGPAPKVDALYFPGYGPQDANPDIGDSAITETNGLGACAMASAPSIVQFIGGKVKDAINYTTKMYEITYGENPAFQIPYLNFRGSPTAIDLRKVINKGILPVINTGVAHRLPGIGQIGAGILNAPSEPFIKAYLALAKKLQNEKI